MDTRPTVIYASDGNDCERLSMSVFSVRKYIGEDTRIIVLSDNTSIDWSNYGTDLEVINPISTLQSVGFHSNGWNRRWPFATLFRLATPLLPELSNCKSVLYLDTDVLVRSPDARQLFYMDFGSHELAGAFDHESKYGRIAWVMDHDVPENAKYQLSTRLWVRCGTRLLTYVNAGVTLWNCEQIRANGLDWYRQRLQWFWEGECQGKFYMLDQDFINVMMDVDSRLSKLLNWFGGDKDTNCIIQHFVAGTKGAMEPTVKHLGYTS